MKHEVREIKVDVRGLTRREIKDLDADGLKLDEVGAIEDLEEREAARDRVLKLAAPDLDPLDLSPAECMELYVLVTRLTYLGDGELKNFAESQPSGTKGGSRTAARARKRGSRSKGAARK